MRKEQRFEIDANTYTLKIRNREADKVILSNQIKYEIPIYQRPYSWGEAQIKKFISDIFISFWGNNGEGESDSMFIGTMQLSTNKEGKQEIIDGQQRITTLTLFLKVLQLESSCSELSNLKFDWLETKVNSGKQQEYLNECLQIDSLDVDAQLNKYIQNIKIIRSVFLEQIEEKNDFNVERFIEHLYSQIYFVVIETKAGLSKTLQIFDAINTTGLDLGAGDVFKIRMFDYLKSENNAEDTVFEEISELYCKIDDENKKLGRVITDILGILNIYQFYLIAKYDLPKVLYSYGVDRFFEELFDTMFDINIWQNFKGVKSQNLELSLKEIDEIIDVRFEWEHNWKKGYGGVESTNLQYLWWWSRYGRYSMFNFLFLYQFKDAADRYEKLYEFSQKLIKIYLVFSVRFQKQVNEITGGFNNELLKLLIHSDYDRVIKYLDNYLNDEHRKEHFKNVISGNILDNNKKKNILCRLSALIEEFEVLEGNDFDLVKKVFEEPIDIEHIQSYNDENTEERIKIQEEWGNDLHSLGNLVVLEQDINRSISNHESKKLDGYKKSKYKIVNTELVSKYELGWDLDKCRKRKEEVVKKIMDYIWKKSSL